MHDLVHSLGGNILQLFYKVISQRRRATELWRLYNIVLGLKPRKYPSFIAILIQRTFLH